MFRDSTDRDCRVLRKRHESRLSPGPRETSHDGWRDRGRA